MTKLSRRELNRTLLVRQMLVERVELTPFELVRHLVAVHTVRIQPWHPLSAADEAAVRAEAECLLGFIAPQTHGAVVIDA
ncbi:hypothetical protein OG874_24185 [Nocardia sp. NBC_00565]|uniref:hypothetical protein n=1 Tax=Nocardia sp. NBC_00565 TaxID=2975993 RepID=UPI002E8101DE|nr:hypothetical protein [Nocardia sp. NBC_00565]WUC00010.1 hypothetical protein OG874_24185 [Nocardia sp. NBC_00565]